MRRLGEEERLLKEESMRIGDERHRKFHELVKQVVWKGRYDDRTTLDWTLGEWKHVAPYASQ